MCAPSRSPDSPPGSVQPSEPGRSPIARPLLAAALFGLTGCANLEFSRETQTAGTFHSTAFAFTIISVDIPRSAIDAARENVTDARQPNVVMTRATVWPYLGPADWLLDIIGVRWAVVSGTWGFQEE